MESSDYCSCGFPISGSTGETESLPPEPGSGFDRPTVPLDDRATPVPGRGPEGATGDSGLHELPILGKVFCSVQGRDIPCSMCAALREAFEPRKLLGRGGMGEVWEAQQRSLQRIVAIKRPRPDRLSRQHEEERRGTIREFEREALIASCLEHPNIMPVYDFGIGPDGMPVLAMKRVQGRPWESLLQADWPILTPEDFLARHLPSLIGLAQAVAFSHSRGIVHRDIKPTQVMVGEFGEALLMDWGLAMWTPPVRASREFPTPAPDWKAMGIPSCDSATCPAGTPSLMAPEQTLHDASRIGTWTDVFQLGGTLYYMLTGTYPNEDGSGRPAFDVAKECDCQKPEQRAPDRNIPPPLSSLAMWALNRNPDERPTARQVLDELRDFQSGNSRRREAVQLTDQAGQLFESLQQDSAGLGATEFHERCEEVAELLGRALRLWPEHDAGRQISIHNLAMRTQREINFGELTLAESHLRALRRLDAKSPVIVELERALDKEARRQGRVRAQRTILAIAAALLFVAVLVFGITSYRSMQRAAAAEGLARHRAQLVEVERQRAVDEREQAERNLALAREQANRAFELVNQLLDSFKESLDKSGVLPASAGLADAIVHYFHEMDCDTWPEDLRLQHAEKLMAIARSLQVLGRLDDGASLATHASEIRAAMLGPRDPLTIESHSLVARLRADLGQPELGLEAARLALEGQGVRPLPPSGQSPEEQLREALEILEYAR